METIKWSGKVPKRLQPNYSNDPLVKAIAKLFFEQSKDAYEKVYQKLVEESKDKQQINNAN